MANMSNIQTPVGASPGETDSQKRHWLQVFHPPVEQVTASWVQEIVSPESIVAGFIHRYSASGRLIVRSVSLQSPYPVPEADLSALLDILCQDANSMNINRAQGVEDVYFYSMQTIATNYIDMRVQVVENDICRAIAETVRFDCRTYPRPCKVATLMQLPYSLESQQIIVALTAMETHPDYADIRTMESSNTEPYLFSERFISYGEVCGLCEWPEVEQYQNPWTIQVDVMGCVDDHCHSIKG